MSKNSPEWIDFTDTYWDHTYVKKKTLLTKNIRQAWYDASAGNTAFAVLSFLLTQRNAIGGVEVVDEAGFNRTLNTDMAILGPAIQALRSRKHAKMAEFDDLLFGSEYEFLMKQLQVDFPAPPISREEFDDISNQERWTKPPRQTRPRLARKTASAPMPPTEDPLKRAGKGRRQSS
ncbi:hypothetical protein BconGalA64_08000 [Burkholderia contaminans]|nr:hypothetical protein BconGalA64_08000 [Burkholderia contaminans]